MRNQRAGVFAALTLMGIAGLASEARADKYESVVVYAENFNGYKRTRLENGAVKPETFAFGEGERLGSTKANDEANELSFRRVIGTLAAPLAKQNYIATQDADHTDLLILVYWGVTRGSRDQFDSLAFTTGIGNNVPPVTGLSGSQDIYNARLLGYVEKLQFANDVPWFSGAQDIYDEIQESRYFVILQAFDFQLLRREHRQKILWETRFSISEQGNAFGEELAGMTQRASTFFGNGKGKLVRRAYPKGHVHVGEPVPVKE